MKRWAGTIGLVLAAGCGGASGAGGQGLDPVTNRVSTTVHDAPRYSPTANEVWALSLDGPATWRRLNPVPDLPLSEVDRHALAPHFGDQRLPVRPERAVLWLTNPYDFT